MRRCALIVAMLVLFLGCARGEPVEVSQEATAAQSLGAVLEAAWAIAEPDTFGFAYLRDLEGNDWKVEVLAKRIAQRRGWGEAFLDGFIDEAKLLTGAGISVSPEFAGVMAVGLGVNREVFVYYAGAHWAF